MATGDGYKTILYWGISLLTWGAIAFAILAHAADYDQNTRNASLGILGFVTLLYYIAQFCSSSCKYLFNKEESGKIYDYMERMFYTPMHKVMTIQCYHYESRQVRQQDSKGNVTYTTERIRVDTHFATERYYYISWRDISGKFDLDVSGATSQQEKPFVKLHLKLVMKLADDGTESDFYYQKRSFIHRNNLDTHYDFNEALQLAGYKEYTLVRVTDFNPPCFGGAWFILFTLLTFAEFYKIHLDKYSIVQDFDIAKVVSSRRDLNNPQYVQQYIPLMPCIVFMGSIREYSNVTLLPQGELTPPPPPPKDMPAPDPSEIPANVNITMSTGGHGVGISMSQGGQPGMTVGANINLNAPLLQ